MGVHLKLVSVSNVLSSFASLYNWAFDFYRFQVYYRALFFYTVVHFKVVSVSNVLLSFGFL